MIYIYYTTVTQITNKSIVLHLAFFYFWAEFPCYPLSLETHPDDL